ncbi:MAG: CehA/McbA family metallohydrolase [Candidatus Aenigmarchaeota archaeon]|nr:CehA/McbA family metallohydrolase [Candidatus Aenigmarchaeota archaeon]
MKFDIHVHTNHSDGVMPPQDAVKQAAKLLDGIAITDHDTMAGIKAARLQAKKSGIIFIQGLEITTASGDILALGVEKIPKTKDILEILDNIRQQGGVSIIAHPYAGYFPVSLADMAHLLKGKIDAIEVYNASTSMPANLEASRLAKKLGILGVAGSDAHFLEMIGAAYTISDDSDIITAIKCGKVKVGWV